MSGWKWVPVEPTTEMVLAGVDAVNITDYAAGVRAQWLAMLNAAPPPAADAVSITDAMVDRALDAWWGCTPPSAGYAPDERDDMRAAIAAALAARDTK